MTKQNRRARSAVETAVLLSASIATSAFAGGSIAAAQSLTPDPGAWRPMAYANLQVQTSMTATFVDIWQDAIEENNRAYLALGDRRFVGGNAPATEAHFIIWSRSKSVVLSILNTARGCEVKERSLELGVTVKSCPMRLVFYEGIRARAMDAGKGCFLEIAQASANEPTRNAKAAAYASYDAAAKIVRTGLIVDGKAVDGCSQNIPLYPQ